MPLSWPYVAVSLRWLGETEAGFAGERPAKGYPSRAVTQGRPTGLPRPFSLSRYCPLMPLKLPPEGRNEWHVEPPSMWPYFPEKSGHIFWNAQASVGWSKTANVPVRRQW